MQSSSDWLSNDMGVHAYFDHTDSLGRDPWVRMCDFSYCYQTWKGENIAAGYATANDVFAAWMASPGHNANMLGANYVVMGISRKFVQGSPYAWYWTNDFGGVASGAAAPVGGPTSTPRPTPVATLNPSGAPDHDGFITSLEQYIGTDPLQACGQNAWPPDTNGDGAVDISDVISFSQVLNSPQKYNARYDLNADHHIALSDILTLAQDFNSTCAP